MSNHTHSSKVIPAVMFCSGAGLAPFIWDDVRSELPADIATSVASRRGDRPTTLLDAAEEALIDAPAQQFIVVGHSLGAAVGLAIAAAVPERVVGILAIAGVVPRPNTSFIAAMPFPNRLILSAMMRVAGTRPPDKAIRKSLCSGVGDDVAERIIDSYVTESQSLFRSPVPIVPRSVLTGYVRTSDDLELPASLQDRFVDEMQPSWITTRETGHLPMLEDSTGVATAIADFSRSVRATT